MYANGILSEDMAETGNSDNTRSFQDLEQLPDNQANELYAEFERRRRVCFILNRFIYLSFSQQKFN